MGKAKNLRTSRKQKIINSLSKGKDHFAEISKELCWVYQMIKKAECKLKRFIAKQPLLTSAQIFERAGIEGLRKAKSVE